MKYDERLNEIQSGNAGIRAIVGAELFRVCVAIQQSAYRYAVAKTGTANAEARAGTRAS